MNRLHVGIATVILIVVAVLAYALNSRDPYVIHSFEKIRLSSTFYAEGAAIGDLNRDGHPDVVCGPYWYEGPDFDRRNAFYEPQEVDPHEYSDNFIVAVDDVNGNGWNDILIVGFPGQEAFWYENPRDEEELWKSHLIFPEVDNESPTFTDFTGNGMLELVFHSDGYLGYAARDTSDPTQPWTFNRISEQGDWGAFNHGLGLGDVTGNGRRDLLMSDGWWEHPGSDEEGSLWQHHPADFGPGGAQMYTHDVDGDGLNDVITTLDAHGWGLAWFRQVRNGDDIHFERNLIMGEAHADNPYGVRFSQPHALALVDVDDDGLNDLVTGKRFWAHGPDGDPEPNAPAVIYWFKLDRDADGEVDFIPYMIDDDSGAGVEIATGDLTGNGYPDIVTCNKKGSFVFLNRPETVSREEWQAAQPERVND